MSNSAARASAETLKDIRTLPDDILADLGKLIVNRWGDDSQSYMITEDIIGHVAPNISYLVTPDGLVHAEAEALQKSDRQAPREAPRHVRVTGEWDKVEDFGSADANIFGGLASLTIPHSALDIPEAPPTDEALAYYDARLIKVGDRIVFQTDHNLLVAIMRIGRTYVDRYLKIEEKGGGSYIEYHDLPHFHMPLEETAGGHMILGRSEDDAYCLSAFKIPYGYGLYTAPYALHADAYLVGRYLVVYSVTKLYSTVVVRSPDRRLVDMRIVPVATPS